jgi:hypothetical protein
MLCCNEPRDYFLPAGHAGVGQDGPAVWQAGLNMEHDTVRAQGLLKLLCKPAGRSSIKAAQR